MLAGTSCTRYRDWLGVIDAPRNGFFQRIGRLGEGFGFASAEREAFGEVAERDDQILAGGVGAKSGGSKSPSDVDVDRSVRFPATRGRTGEHSPARRDHLQPRGPLALSVSRPVAAVSDYWRSVSP